VTKDTGAVIARISEKAWRPFSVSEKWAYAITLPGFALLTWALARVSVPLPGTPVPATLQSLSVLLAGLFLGARKGSLSQALYLGAGLAGLPVFALPGSGPAYFLGPTGGYLLGFVLAPWIVGRIAPAGVPHSLSRRLVAVVAGGTALHVCGTLWLMLVWSPGPQAALLAGSLPFLAFDLAKGIVAIALHAAGRSLGGVLAWTNRAV
jgi:biotin transport system substrate-specific component